MSIETSEYIYDNNGNQISKSTFSLSSAPSNAQLGIYILGEKRTTARENYTIELNEYDVYNRLINVKNDEGTAIYTYKADGMRLSKDVNGKKTTHVWDGSNIVLDYGATNDRYIRGINLMKSDSNGFYLYNAHGDVVQLANSSGAVTKVYQYDAFGVEKDKDASDNNPFRYCGEYYDKETETIYLRARYYEPTTGRFTSEDPIGSGLNWYTYCINNPVDFIDPSGLDAIWLTGSSQVVFGYNSEYNRTGIPLGHTSIMMEYEGAWYYFLYGSSRMFLAEVVDLKMLESLDSLNKGLDKYLDTEEYTNFPYDSATYIEGDFTESYLFCEALVNSTTKIYDPAFNGVFNNCILKSYQSLRLGTISDGTNFETYLANYNELGVGNIPNLAMLTIEETFGNNSYTKDEARIQIQSRIDEVNKKSSL